MTTLINGKARGEYLITKVNGEPALALRLAELGFSSGKTLTLINSAQNSSGLVVYLAGQRLAVSQSLAELVQVTPLNDAQALPPIPLAQLAVGQACVVQKITGSPALRKRLLDMGLTRNTVVKIYRLAPLGDPIELELRGYKLSIRQAEAQQILVKKVQL
ncbi:MAG TPA: ferrous iron transport protein A [Candidatus Ligilactobacillus excrementipullorum]|nr:ferrous iron transport protein A [Candidatus Ligilactobacillus excrementipullorum]